MKINVQQAFRNSPRKELIKTLTTLFASYQTDKLKKYFDNDISWTLVGDLPIKGKEVFIAELEKMKADKVSVLTINAIVTHGKEAAVHGQMEMENGTVYGFSDFYQFKSAGSDKIKEITSYVVKI